MSGLSRLGLALGLLAAAASSAAAHHPGHAEEAMAEREPLFRAVDRPAPDIPLVDAEGRPAPLSELQGAVLLVHVAPAGCGEPCRLQAGLLAEVQAMARATPMSDRVRIRAVRSGVQQDRDPDDWLGAVGWPVLAPAADAAPEAVRRLEEAFGHGADGGRPEAMAVGVIDPQGRWRGAFHGLSFEPANVALFINALLEEEAHRPATDDAPSWWEWLRSWL